MTRDLKGWARPRPLRVAFLIEDGEHANLALDGIVADCYNRWGGRFSLIAPCLNGRIASSYWPWLEAYDPDIVYSYVPLSRPDVLEVHERLSPAQYAFHEREPKLGALDFKPSYDGFAPLSSLSVIFRLARHSPAAVKIIDSWPTERPSRFLTDNFGTYFQSRASSIYPPDAAPAANLLTIVSPEIDQRLVPTDRAVIPTEMTAFSEFAEGRVTSLSLASTLYAPRLDIRAAPRWSGSFNLVVGEGFADRIMFWNGRLLIPAWLDRDLCCLRVGLDELEQPAFLTVLGNLLRLRNRVNTGAGGQPQLTVRSTSLGTEQLTRARDLVRSTQPASAITAEAVTVDGIVPETGALQAATENDRFFGSSRNWTRFLWSAPTARPPASVPDHLSDAPVRQDFTRGHWCTDFVLEYDGPTPRFAEQNRWMLPRRWRMAGVFKTSLVGEPWFAVPSVRRNRDGNLTVFVSADHPVETIKVPTCYEAMRYALATDGPEAQPDAEHEKFRPSSKVVWIEPSNEARYLTGVLGMTGGLRRAIQFLLHPFLREHFAKLGGTPSVPTDKLTPTVDRLVKRAQRESVFDLRNDRERQALADLLVKAARALKSPMSFVSYDDLKASWKAHRAAYWAANPLQEKRDSNVDWDKLEEESLDDCLIELRRRQIMFQGHRWTCPKCHHRNWINFDALSAELSCEICKRPEQAPVNIPWLFRPNEFLIESLRDHSVLSLVWVLSVLCERSKRSLMFVEPLLFGLTPDSAFPDAEADLLVVLDGQAILCEVKSSWRSLRSAEIADFVALARRLRPDTALLAVMDDSAGRPTADIAERQAQLATEGIKFELLTGNAYKPQDDRYLHFDDDE